MGKEKRSQASPAASLPAASPLPKQKGSSLATRPKEKTPKIRVETSPRDGAGQTGPAPAGAQDASAPSEHAQDTTSVQGNEQQDGIDGPSPAIEQPPRSGFDHAAAGLNLGPQPVQQFSLMKSIDNVKELWSKIKKKSKSNFNLTENPPARAGSTRTDSNFHDLTNSESSIDGIADLQEFNNSDTDEYRFNSYDSYGNTTGLEDRLDR